jgi:hypothetical protein
MAVCPSAEVRALRLLMLALLSYVLPPCVRRVSMLQVKGAALRGTTVFRRALCT